MSRGTASSRLSADASRRSWRRPLAVWLAVTVVTVGALAVSAPLLSTSLLSAGGWATSPSFERLLVQVSAAALTLATLRLWLVTTVTVAQLAAGRRPAGGGATRRLVLAACGAAFVAGVGSPAWATGGDHVLDGLRLPERAVATPVGVEPSAAPAAQASTTAPSGRRHRVEPGESLWSIAETTSPAGTDLDQRWRAIWEANRAVVGDDPDLILPGQQLRLPAAEGQDRDTPGGPARTTPQQSTDETGDRP